MSLVIKDISDGPEDLDRLSRFYHNLYIAGFPDPNERESLCNMKRYLKLRRDGWYGKNHYHILLALDGDRTVAASVSDYLAIPNFGIIEFLLVDESLRGRGIGRLLHDATVEKLDADARRNGRSGVDGIVIELNDPFLVAPHDDNYDPFERAMIWNRWGYGRLCFPYVQPALSADQQPVTCLLLAMKPIAAGLKHAVSPALMCDVLAGYLRWAMRIDAPEANPTFAAMMQFMSKQSSIQIEPLAVYIGRDPDKPLAIKPIESTSDPAFKIATDLYARAFPPGPTVIDVEMFGHALQWFVGRRDCHYHLWGLAIHPDDPIAGMASFFVTPRFGFGGYLALEPPLKGTRRSGIIVKRIEEQIIRDEPNAHKHYIECVPNSSEEAVFLNLGFTPVPVRYHQPPTSAAEQFGTGAGPEITLLIKRLGCDRDSTLPSADDFLEDLKILLADVYRLSEPEQSQTFQIARATYGRYNYT
jgi:GNAT superfamily N-acetyltransferase